MFIWTPIIIGLMLAVLSIRVLNPNNREVDVIRAVTSSGVLFLRTALWVFLAVFLCGNYI